MYEDDLFGFTLAEIQYYIELGESEALSGFRSH